MDKLELIVKDIFGDYLLSYNFRRINIIDSSVAYQNDYCIFVFSIDYSEILLSISKANYPEEVFSISGIYKAVMGQFPEIPTSSVDLTQRFYIILEYYRKFLISNLPKLPLGDFSWINTYNKWSNRGKELMKKLWSLKISDPIYIKFQNGDKSFWDDLEKLL